MRLLILSLLLSLSMILASCGGGGGGTSSLKEARLAIDVDFENSRTTENGFYVSNTEIGSVKLSYTNNAGSGGTVDITSAASGGRVQLSELIIETTYSFTVTAYAADGAEACTGSASVYISPNADNEVDLACVFEDEYAMENSAYDFVTLAFADGSTASDIDEFISDDFGILNGMTRTEFINDILSDEEFGFADSGVTLDRVDIIMASERAASRAGGQEAFLYLYFTDGSVSIERIWMVKENGKWVITGNGRKYEAEIEAEAFFITGAVEENVYGQGVSETFFSGLSTDFYDPADLVEGITVTGPGLSQPYQFAKYDCTDCDGFYISSPEQMMPYGMYDDFINLYDSALNDSSALQTDGVYTIATSYADGTSDTFTTTLYGRPTALSSLTEGHFARVTSPASYALADYVGNTITFQYVKPSAYTAMFIEYNIELSDYYGEWYDMEGAIPLNSGSFTLAFPADVGFEPAEARMELTAYDSEGKSYTTVIVLDVYADSGLADAVSETMSENLAVFTESDLDSVVAVFAAADDASVQGVLGALASASGAGLTAAEVREAADEAGMRRPSSGPALDAYNSLVAAFQAAYSAGNNGIVTAVQNIVRNLTDNKLTALAAMANAASSAGFDNVAAAFKQAVDSGEDIVTPAPETDADRLAQDLGNLTLDDILGLNESAARLTSDLEPVYTLPNGTQLTWESSNENAMLHDGTINRPYYGFGDAPVSLTVTAALGSASETFEFSFYVAEQDLVNPAYVAEVEAFVSEVVTDRTRTAFIDYVDPYMTYMNGMTRDMYISQGMPYGTDLLVEDFEVYAQLSGSKFLIRFKIAFPNGNRSDRFLWVEKLSDSNWYITGNDRMFFRRTEVMTAQRLPFEGEPRYVHGLNFKVTDVAGLGIKMVVVDGPGLPDGQVKLVDYNGSMVLADMYRNTGSTTRYDMTQEQVLEYMSIVMSRNYATYKYTAYTDYDPYTMEPLGTPLQTIEHNLFDLMEDTGELAANYENYFPQIVSITGFDSDSMLADGGIAVDFVMPENGVLYGNAWLACSTMYGDVIELETDVNAEATSLLFDFTGVPQEELEAIVTCQTSLTVNTTLFKRYRVFFPDTTMDTDSSAIVNFDFMDRVNMDYGISISGNQIQGVRLIVAGENGFFDNMDVTEALYDGYIQVDGLSSSLSYGAMLTAYDMNGNTICMGETLLEPSADSIISAGVDCVLQGEYAFSGTVLELMKDLSDLGSVSPSDFDALVDTEFTTVSGMDRTAYLQYLSDTVSSGVINSGAEVIGVTVTTVAELYDTYETIVLVKLSSGETAMLHLWVKPIDDSNFLITSNGTLTNEDLEASVENCGSCHAAGMPAEVNHAGYMLVKGNNIDTGEPDTEMVNFVNQWSGDIISAEFMNDGSGFVTFAAYSMDQTVFDPATDFYGVTVSAYDSVEDVWSEVLNLTYEVVSMGYDEYSINFDANAELAGLLGSTELMIYVSGRDADGVSAVTKIDRADYLVNGFSAVKIFTTGQALAYYDSPDNPRNLVGSYSCSKCHSYDEFGFAHNMTNRMTESSCASCHTDGSYVSLVHGIHSSSIFYAEGSEKPGYISENGTEYSALYPNNMADCGVCHVSEDQYTNAAVRLTGETCITCHGSFEAVGNLMDPAVVSIHNSMTESTDCASCHDGQSAPDLALIHENTDYMIAKSKGKDISYEVVSVTVGTGYIQVAWRAADVMAQGYYDIFNSDINSGPVFRSDLPDLAISYPPRIYFGIFEGDDIVQLEDMAMNRPADINSVITSETTADTGADGIVVTTIPIEFPVNISTRGYVSIQGSPSIIDGDAVIPVLTSSAGFAFSMEDGTDVGQRRQVVEIERCNTCHGTITAHGQNRTNNIESCLVCHTPNATDASARGYYEGTGIDTHMDGKKETRLDFKSMIHGIHSASVTNEPYIIYRTRGIYMFRGAQTSVPESFGFGDANWVDTVVGYPRAINNCSACHIDEAPFADPSVVAPVTVDQGNALYTSLDDKFISPNSAACSSCHAGNISNFTESGHDSVFDPDLKNSFYGYVEAGIRKLDVLSENR